jgi:hypothetical protein
VTTLGDGLAARSTDLFAATSVDVAVTYVDAEKGSPGHLGLGLLAAFGAWPPSFDPQGAEVNDVLDYVSTSGPATAAGLVETSSGLVLATELFPTSSTMPQATPGDHPLFVAALASRWLYGSTRQVVGAFRMDVGSYQMGSLEQNESPTSCTSSQRVGAAVASGQGFLGAYALRNPPSGPSCSSAPSPGTVLSFYRYDAPSEPGSFITTTEGDHLVAAEPWAELALTERSDGAWAFHRTDGSTAEQVPAVLGTRIDQGAHITPVGAPDLVVAPDGAATGTVSAARIGDGAVVGWVGPGPAGPTISLRTVTASGALGDIVTFSTDAAPVGARLRLQPSSDGQKVLVAWEVLGKQPVTGLARLDCSGGTN